MRCGEHDIGCMNHGDCDAVGEMLRGLRRQIGDLESRNGDGYRIRAEAMAILFNAEHRNRVGR